MWNTVVAVVHCYRLSHDLWFSIQSYIDKSILHPFDISCLLVILCHTFKQDD